LGVNLYNASSSPWGPGRNICESHGSLVAEATGMKLALSLLMYMHYSSTYQAVLTGFHSGVSLRTEKCCLLSSLYFWHIHEGCPVICPNQVEVDHC